MIYYILSLSLLLLHWYRYAVKWSSKDTVTQHFCQGRRMRRKGMRMHLATKTVPRARVRKTGEKINLKAPWMTKMRLMMKRRWCTCKQWKSVVQMKLQKQMRDQMCIQTNLGSLTSRSHWRREGWVEPPVRGRHPNRPKPILSLPRPIPRAHRQERDLRPSVVVVVSLLSLEARKCGLCKRTQSLQDHQPSCIRSRSSRRSRCRCRSLKKCIARKHIQVSHVQNRCGL